LTDASASVTFRPTTAMNNHLLLSPALAKSLFWVAVCLCGVAHLAIIRSIVRSVPRRRTEIAWAVIPAVALAAVLVMTWRTLYVSA
jgi:hypothetical protein